MLSPVPIAPQNTQKMRDWVQTFGVAARQMAKAGTLLSYLNQREIWLGEPVSFKLSHFEEQQKKKKLRPQQWQGLDESFPDDETACDDSHSIFGMRDSFYPQKIFPTSEEVFASIEELCYGSNRSNGIVVTFFVTYLLTLLFVSLKLTCLYWYVYPWSKLKGRKLLPWQVYIIHAKLWKLQNEQYCWGEKR